MVPGNLGDFYELITRDHEPFDIVYSIDKTVRDGRTFPQFKIKDIKVKENN
jgi:hypothetical protein